MTSRAIFLILLSLVYSAGCGPIDLSENDISPRETPNKSTTIVDKVNEIADVGCNLCLKAFYGVNYNVIRLKKAAEEMITKDCEALFDPDGEAVARCIRTLVKQIEHFYDKVEPSIETRHMCVRLGMCAPETPESITSTSNEIIELPKTTTTGAPERLTSTSNKVSGFSKTTNAGTSSTTEPSQVVGKEEKYL